MIYKKMSLFDAPKNSIIAHACNAQGVWNSGIAKEFKARYPKAFSFYKDLCRHEGVGGSILIPQAADPQGGPDILCLITSYDFGDKKDDKTTILIQTVMAFEKFFSYHCWHKDFSEKTIYICKINSGKFEVPWEETEKILKFFEKRYNMEFVVCDPELKE